MVETPTEIAVLIKSLSQEIKTESVSRVKASICASPLCTDVCSSERIS